MTNSFDRLLRDALEAQADRGGACLDADTVAAWCDGTLDATARAVAAAHAADCARCQAFMAAMIRTEPPAPAPWWRSRVFGWMAPLAVAAASLLIWVNLPGFSGRDVAVQTGMGPAEPANRAAASPVATAPAQEAPPMPAAEPGQARVAPRAAKESRQRDQSVRQRASAELPPSVSAGPLRDGVSAPVEVPTAPAAPTTAPPVAVSTPPPTSVDAVAPVLQSKPGPAAALPPSPSPTPEPRAGTAKGLAETVSVAAAAGSASPVQPELVIRTPDRLTRWRITTPGRVQRTTDNGASWENQSTGENASVIGGSAPANAVCWLVGRGGLVLLSTDGRTWTRVKFPLPLDLIAVMATDDKTATVTAVDGRRFNTSDGGTTWK